MDTHFFFKSLKVYVYNLVCSKNYKQYFFNQEKKVKVSWNGALSKTKEKMHMCQQIMDNPRWVPVLKLNIHVQL